MSTTSIQGFSEFDLESQGDHQDVTLHFNEYKLNFMEALEKVNEDFEIPNYDNFVKLFNLFAHLSENILNKSKNQEK